MGIVLAFFGNGASIRANEYLKPLSRPLLLFYRNGNFRHAHIDSFILWLERDMEIDSTVIKPEAVICYYKPFEEMKRECRVIEIPYEGLAVRFPAKDRRAI
ncbi:MAG: hypothetical protein RRY79_00270 [Clostridia bacterium]